MQDLGVVNPVEIGHGVQEYQESKSSLIIFVIPYPDFIHFGLVNLTADGLVRRLYQICSYSGTVHYIMIQSVIVHYISDIHVIMDCGTDNKYPVVSKFVCLLVFCQSGTTVIRHRSLAKWKKSAQFKVEQ
ncbi:hypothetical protein M8J77_009412 [Diaphorina citri]|nr:hypothetical protein M8J77_009412 [Diaphorina citri]